MSLSWPFVIINWSPGKMESEERVRWQEESCRRNRGQFSADALQARLMVRLSIYTRVCSKLKDFETVPVQK